MNHDTITTRSVTETGSIRLNQIGYRPEDEKTAFITSNENSFRVYDSDGNIVYRGDTAPLNADAKGCAAVDAKSGDRLWKADFSSVSRTGTYHLTTGNCRSPFFRIGDTVYSDILKAVLKLFYYQRCGREGVKAAYSGEKFSHAPCHITTAKYFDDTDPVYGSVCTDVSGGWHDAGDYGRYVTPAAKTAADLMLTAELFPFTSELDFGGPVKLLPEARYELEWMMKMQHPRTGGVYHKVTTRIHADIETLPEKDHSQLFLSPVSAQASGDFAAVMALASRIYKNEDAAFAARCITAAEKAWHWLSGNPDADAYTDPSFFRTGSYNDAASYDERCWAAAELYRATGASSYLRSISESRLPEPGFGWAGVGSYAMVSYLLAENAEKDGLLYNKTKERYMESVGRIISAAGNDGYRTGLGKYIWGSNMDVANNAMALIMADMISPNPEYEKIILDQFHYLMGRNANNISYVTGCGEKAARNPHHRQSVIMKEAVPGMLVGGPFENIMHLERDPASGLFSKDTPPAKCYADVSASFSSNEICIYWNSPLAFVLGYLNRPEKGNSNGRKKHRI